jgi:hypothetical protein
MMVDQRHFSFQLQFGPTKAAADDALTSELVHVIKSSGGSSPEVESGQDGNDLFCNINVYAEDAYGFWSNVRSQIFTDNLSRALAIMIVVCEGNNGWDDYLLLYHHDNTEKCDNLNR